VPLIGPGFVGLLVLLLARTARHAPGACSVCGYSLTDKAIDVSPECGSRIESDSQSHE
jgi:hypothetical protein